MSDLTNNAREALVHAIAKELDTRDKRFMFLKISFPNLVSRIQIEGSAMDAAYQIYWEFEKQSMVGSLMSHMNSYFELDLILETK